MNKIKTEHILVTDNNVIVKEYDNRYYEYLIFRMINGRDFGFELNIYYRNI